MGIGQVRHISYLIPDFLQILGNFKKSWYFQINKFPFFKIFKSLNTNIKVSSCNWGNASVHFCNICRNTYMGIFHHGVSLHLGGFLPM